MKQEGNSDSVLELPHLAEIFDTLRHGKHISARDGDIFHSLKNQETLYESLFTNLGFKLVHNARDFFYFFDASNFTDLSARMAVFMFILVESMADKGVSVEENIMTRHFNYKDLPHLQTERYQVYMRDAGITTPDELASIVRTMERFGFTRRFDEETFGFEVPVYRFLDLCMDMAPKSPRSQDGTAQSDNNDGVTP